METHLSTGQDDPTDTTASCSWNAPGTRDDKVNTCNGEDTCNTDLGIGLTHGLVQRLVVMDVLLQHGDVVTDLRHLAASAPPRHALDVLKYFSN